MADELRLPIRSDDDIVAARAEGRRLASWLDFSATDLTVIATAISEVARNILEYAGSGEIELRLINDGVLQGIKVAALDQGPGIEDLDLALRDGYSSRDGLGLGLPGTRRLMDDFEVQSEAGKGTTVRIAKWARRG